ncbi:MAG: AAA family ATPase [Pseudomonadota bacterium]
MNAPSLSIQAGGNQQRSCAAFVHDEASAALISAVLAEHGWTSERVSLGGINQAIKQLAIESSPDFLIIDLGDARDARANINALAEVVEPGTIVLTIGSTNDVALYRDLLSSGIQDYLVKPVSSELLREALLNIEMALAAPSQETDDPASHRICGFIGVRGGVGASTLASSCAWLIAHHFKKKAALLDLDIHFGTDALAFDLEPGRGLLDALENPGRIDSLFIERALIKESDNLALLGAEAPIGEPMVIDPTALSHLQGELKNSYELVLVDLPRTLLPTHHYLVQAMNDIVVVVDMSLPAARDTIRILGFLKEHAPDAKVHLVANKVPGGSQVEIARGDFENAVERKIDMLLPIDVKAASLAAKKGKSIPQITTASKLSGQMKLLAEKLVGDLGETSGQGFWDKVNGLLRGSLNRSSKKK